MTTRERKDAQKCHHCISVGPLVAFTTDGEVAIRTKDDKHPEEWHFYADGYITHDIPTKGINNDYRSLEDVMLVNKDLRDFFCFHVPQQNPLPYKRWLQIYAPTASPELEHKYPVTPGANDALKWAVYYATVATKCGEPPKVQELN